MRAMILAAGRGSRMGDLTKDTPKPLLKIGRYALIEWQILRLARAGVVDVVINLAYLGEKIADFLGDGTRYGVRIVYSVEPEGGLETAGGVIQALPLLGEAPFLLLNADVWCDFDYSLWRFLRFEEAEAYLLLVPNPKWKSKGDFDLAGTRVLPGSSFTFSGISMISPRLFQGASVGFLPLAPFLHRASERGRLFGTLFLGQWQDVGTKERLAILRERYGG